MASNQDYTEDMAQGDFSNESYGDFQQQEQQPAQENAEANGNEAMEETTTTTNGDGHESSSQDPLGKDEDR